MNSLPTTLVIFGASGDLTSRKLIPSLYRMAVKKRLPDELRIVGLARSRFTHDQFREKMANAIKEFASREWSSKDWDSFAQRLFYVAGDAGGEKGLDGLHQWLSE